METLKVTELEERKGIKRLPGIKGRWKLVYTPSNPLNSFGGKGLNSYTNPRTGREIPLMDLASGRKRIQYIVDSLERILNPNKPQDLVDIEWLIHHPDVVVQGYESFGEEYKQRKNLNSPIKLISLDNQEMSAIEDEDFIDKLIGRLSLEGGTRAIGLDNLRVLLSSLGMSYRDSRYIKNPSVEKSFLRKTLKTFVRKHIDNAKAVADKIDNLDNFKGEFFVKEMIRLKIFTWGNGMYHYKGNPVAISVPRIVDIWQTEPATKEAHMSALELAKVEELR